MANRSWTLIAAVLLGLVLAPTASVAQQQGGQEETNEHQRSGFWFNGGLGWGSLGCDGCTDREGGTVLSLGVGGTVSQSVLIGGSIDGWTKEEQGTRLTASSALATIRLYPSDTDGFFFRGGLGFGSVETEIAGVGSGSESGGAALLGLGYDVRVSDNVSLTPFLNGVGITTDDTDVNFNQLGLSVTTH